MSTTINKLMIGFGTLFPTVRSCQSPITFEVTIRMTPRRHFRCLTVGCVS